MMTLQPRAGLAGASACVGVAALWLALALTHPATTYHFAPTLVSAAWPVAQRWRHSEPVPLLLAARSALAGSLVALASAGFLEVRHALGSPTLVGFANAWVEVLVGIVLGAVLGGWVAARGYQAHERKP